MSTVTCRTRGCANRGIPIDMELDYIDVDTGQTVTITTVLCGVCGEPITDIAESAPPPDPRPEPKT